uniref:Uncharacterized protein n=1 Tax=Sphaerodactylus townsendi TaxID=933632 RepID=A0ACB8G686_9SAUR
MLLKVLSRILRKRRESKKAAFDRILQLPHLEACSASRTCLGQISFQMPSLPKIEKAHQRNNTAEKKEMETDCMKLPEQPELIWNPAESKRGKTRWQPSFEYRPVREDAFSRSSKERRHTPHTLASMACARQVSKAVHLRSHKMDASSRRVVQPQNGGHNGDPWAVVAAAAEVMR